MRAGWQRLVNRGAASAIGAGSLLAHLVLTFRGYPLSSLLRGEVPWRGDLYRYFATAYGMARIGRLYGYDPFFMAGYPAGLWNSMGKKGFEIFHLLFPWVPLPALFCIVIPAVCLLSPLLLWWTLRRHGPTRRAKWILWVACLGYWHMSTHLSYFWSFGNIFFPAACCVLIACLATLWRIVEEKRGAGYALAAGILAGVIFYWHTVVLVAGMAPALAMAVLCRRRLADRRVWLHLGLALAVFLVLAVWWLVPLLRYRQDLVALPKPWFQAGWKHLVMDLFSDRGYRQPYDRNFLYHFAVVFGIAGAWLARADPRRRLLCVLAAGGAGCLLIAYTFSYVPVLAPVQPYRFLVPAVLFLLAPMAVYLDHAVDVVRAMRPAGRCAVLLLVVLTIPRLTGYMIEVPRARSNEGLPDTERCVLRRVGELQMRGRLLCDNRLGYLAPWACNVPVIGGLSAQAFLAHRFAGVDHEGVLFGKRPEDWTAAALKTYLDTYAVEYALFMTGPWLAFAARAPGLFERVQTIGAYQIFRVRDAARSYVLDGEAEAFPDYDGIAVRHAASPELTLKLHYAIFLEANNGVTLRPARVLDSPVPFIRASVPAGVNAFEIRRR